MFAIELMFRNRIHNYDELVSLKKELLVAKKEKEALEARCTLIDKENERLVQVNNERIEQINILTEQVKKLAQDILDIEGTIKLVTAEHAEAVTAYHKAEAEMHRVEGELNAALAQNQAARDAAAQAESVVATLRTDLANLTDKAEIDASYASLQAKFDTLSQMQAGAIDVDDELEITRTALREVRQILNIATPEEERQMPIDEEGDGEEMDFEEAGADEASEQVPGQGDACEAETPKAACDEPASPK